ncbi:hypothetical protein HK097_006367 [Rhizophlyctis rosea]|uniref:P-loop containing nucleoside triphosphate hydrolase protein n=1 Tax=Rhizophlyctis rosea TaxID=64517 RepID=A0AAD5SLQ2_9FUNG|nr:hypothetical protein HK097_006367 [Rhizophlyctis rosea]
MYSPSGAFPQDRALSTFDPTDKVRVVVVGDPGVGKTSLLNILCHGEPLRAHARTAGVNVDVKVHDHTRTSKPYFVEFIDVAGSCKHRHSRSIFYSNINGIILVHDTINRKSYNNLWKWIQEVFNSEPYQAGNAAKAGSMSKSTTGLNYDVDLRIGSNTSTKSRVPILVVGTKVDAAVDQGFRKRCSITEEFGGEAVYLNTQSVESFIGVSDRFDSFLNDVINTRFASRQDGSIGRRGVLGSYDALNNRGSIDTLAGGVSPEMHRRPFGRAGSPHRAFSAGNLTSI